MTRINDVEKLIAKISRGTAPSMTCANAIERDGHLLPDLPKPTNNDPDYAPVWQVGGTEYEGQHDGSVLIDTGSPSGPLVITRQQVLLILAASESRGAHQ
ncbi:hypothetical protein BJF89_13830 [Corynebacterium sp. CNJ-954]|nr:hypothetical protein BJF89_13830 [Corynebacterium sp. CNJ-954]